MNIHTLRCTVEADYPSKTFYVTGDSGQYSWGVSFEFKNGYSADKPAVSGLSSGTKDGITYWVSAQSRPATHDYFFEVKKNGVVTDVYRIIFII